jgi:hypothetical protein
LEFVMLSAVSDDPQTVVFKVSKPGMIKTSRFLCSFRTVNLS